MFKSFVLFLLLQFICVFESSACDDSLTPDEVRILESISPSVVCSEIEVGGVDIQQQVVSVMTPSLALVFLTAASKVCAAFSDSNNGMCILMNNKHLYVGVFGHMCSSIAQVVIPSYGISAFFTRFRNAVDHPGHHKVRFLTQGSIAFAALFLSKSHYEKALNDFFQDGIYSKFVVIAPILFGFYTIYQFVTAVPMLNKRGYL